MRIYTLWHEGEGEDMPWLVGAVDEYTVDEIGSFPEAYAAMRKLPLHREMIIEVPEKAVRALFEAPVIKAKVEQ